MQFIYLAHYLRKSKWISIKELAYTLRHICWDISAFPALLSDLQDGTETWLANDSIRRGRGPEEHHRNFSGEASQLNLAQEYIILLLLNLVYCGNSLRIALTYDHIIYWKFTPWPCLCCNIHYSLSLNCCFHVSILLILMSGNTFRLNFTSAPVKRAGLYICWVWNKHKQGLFRQVSPKVDYPTRYSVT